MRIFPSAEFLQIPGDNKGTRGCVGETVSLVRQVFIQISAGGYNDRHLFIINSNIKHMGVQADGVPLLREFFSSIFRCPQFRCIK